MSVAQRRKERAGRSRKRKSRENRKAGKGVFEDNDTKRYFWDELKDQCNGTLSDFETKNDKKICFEEKLKYGTTVRRLRRFSS